MDGCPLGLGLVVEDKPTEFSCIATAVIRRPSNNIVIALNVIDPTGRYTNLWCGCRHLHITVL